MDLLHRMHYSPAIGEGFLCLVFQIIAGVGEDELKKIWKGLFYCLWHSDKVHVQADLINKLAGILESLDADTALAFFEVFLTTMRREWNGIDSLRLDKFYRLLRQVLVKVFAILQRSNWDKKSVRKFMNSLVERSLLANDKHPALGVNLHLVDIFLPVLRKFHPLDADTFSLMLQPCYATLGSAPDKSLMKRVKEGVFMPLLEEAVTFVKNTQCGNEVDENSFGPHVVSLSLSARIFELASSETTPQANRKVFYEIHAECTKVDQLVAFAGIDLNFKKIKDSSSPDLRMGEVVVNSATRQSARQIGERSKRASEISEIGVERKMKKIKDVPIPTAQSSHPQAIEPEALNVKTEKNTKKRTLKQAKSRNDKEMARDAGGEAAELIDAEDVDYNLSYEQIKKVDVKEMKAAKLEALVEIAPVEASSKNKRKGKKSMGKEKGNHVLAGVETDRSLELPEQNFVASGVKVAKDGLKAQLGDTKSSTAQFLVGAGMLSGMRDADSMMNLCVKDSVISNLEQKFASIAAESDQAAASNDSSREPISTGFVGKKKRKGPKAAKVAESLLSANSLCPAQSSKSNGVDQMSESNSTKKKVKFVLKNNIVWKPNNPLPPQSMRTPPSATPRGSALKKGVPAGPIRVVSSRKTSSAFKRRSPSQTLSITNQRSARSRKSLSKGPRLARRVRKSPVSL
ncbi:uncharacterized protein [Physcomitrium patens]|nr:ribosomal RNA processing protein 1 homolog B-like isoform X3 [Physcomitrium patens]|eukprot:XP_024390974.1 ribosomal RNA processing protein 1 homolog B-like isoform X3 [Physcomitrella patens]